jgi:hypothetical protein
VTVNLHNGNVYLGGWADGGAQSGVSASLMFGKLNYPPSGSPSGAVVDSFLGGMSGYFCVGALAGVCQVRNGTGTAYQAGFMTPGAVGGVSLAGRACFSRPHLPSQPEPAPEPKPWRPDVTPCTPGFCVNQPNYGLPPGGYRTSA